MYSQAIKIFIKKAILIWTGLCFLVLGVAGVLVPIFPGIILLLIGFILILRGFGRTRERKYLKESLRNLGIKIKVNNNLYKKLISLL